MTYGRAADRVGLVVDRVGEGQVVRARLGRDADPGRLRATDLVERHRRAEVDDVDRRLAPGARRRAPAPSRPPRRTVAAWQRGSAVARHHAARRRRRRRRGGRGPRSGPGACRRGRPSTRIASNSRASGSRKSKTMNAFEVATPASIVAGSSASGSSQWPLTARLSPMSMALSPSVAARHSRTPVAQRSLGRRRRPRPGVVEREERRRAAERRGHGVLEEPVRLRVGGDPRVRVDVDRPGEDEEPGRVDRLARVRAQAAEVRLDRLDPPAADRDVRPPRPVGADHGPARDEEIRRARHRGRIAASSTGSRPASQSADENGTARSGSMVIRGSSAVLFTQYRVAT